MYARRWTTSGKVNMARGRANKPSRSACQRPDAQESRWRLRARARLRRLRGSMRNAMWRAAGKVHPGHPEHGRERFRGFSSGKRTALHPIGRFRVRHIAVPAAGARPAEAKQQRKPFARRVQPNAGVLRKKLQGLARGVRAGRICRSRPTIARESEDRKLAAAASFQGTGESARGAEQHSLKSRAKAQYSLLPIRIATKPNSIA